MYREWGPGATLEALLWRKNLIAYPEDKRSVTEKRLESGFPIDLEVIFFRLPRDLRLVTPQLKKNRARNSGCVLVEVEEKPEYSFHLFIRYLFYMIKFISTFLDYTSTRRLSTD